MRDGCSVGPPVRLPVVVSRPFAWATFPAIVRFPAAETAPSHTGRGCAARAILSSDMTRCTYRTLTGATPVGRRLADRSPKCQRFSGDLNQRAATSSGGGSVRHGPAPSGKLTLAMDAQTTEERKTIGRGKAALRAALAVLGLTAVTVQVLLLRELMVA